MADNGKPTQPAARQEKPKLAMYWASSCGGCEISVLNIHEHILTVDELFELVGVQRVARKYDRQDALCCGSIFIEMDPERGLRVQDKNITDAIGYGADAMVMLCPVCWTRLSQPCRERGLPPVLLVDLCRMALGEKPFPSSVGQL